MYMNVCCTGYIKASKHDCVLAYLLKRVTDVQTDGGNDSPTDQDARMRLTRFARPRIGPQFVALIALRHDCIISFDRPISRKCDRGTNRPSFSDVRTCLR